MNPLEISPEQFRHLANRVTDISYRYLESLPQRDTFPTGASGAKANEIFDTDLPQEGIGDRALDGLEDVLLPAVGIV